MKQLSRSKIIGLALCLGAIAAVLAFIYLSRLPNAEQVITVVTAGQRIPNGTIVEAKMLQLKRLPPDQASSMNIASPELVIGKVATKDINIGEPIYTSSISEKVSLAQLVKPFMRAVTVAVDPVIGVGGFLKPGDHVDVLATFNVNDGTIAKTVLQDVQLIAIGSEIVDQYNSDIGGKVKPQVQTSATLAVMPMDAEKLVLADSKGKIRLALRRSDDPSYVATKGITGRGLLGKVPSDVPQQNQNVSVPAVIHEPAMLRMPITQSPFASKPAVQIKPMAVPDIVKAVEVKTIQVVRGTKVEDTVVPD